MAIKIQGVAKFHPGWGGPILATGGAAIASLFHPLTAAEIDEVVGFTLTTFSVIGLAVVLTIIMLRIMLFRSELIEDLTNPGLGALLGTTPAGAIVVGIAVTEASLAAEKIEEAAIYLAWFLFAIGTVGTLLVGITFFTNIVQRSELPITSISGAWFIPIVALVLTPNLLFRIAQLENVIEFNLAFILSVALWGAAFLLFVFLGSVIAWRLITTPPPPAHMATSWFIWLAPASAGALGIIAILRWSSSLVSVTSAASFTFTAFILATLMWGFATWWLIFAGVQITKLRKELEYHIGSWGFVFPFAAYVALTIVLARDSNSQTLAAFAIGAWVALILLWLRIVSLMIRSRQHSN